MLSRRPFSRRPPSASQQGLVLVVALIVLVLVTLGGLAIMRSVDTATLVAGNLAVQQAATRASDTGVQRAVAMVRQKATDGTLSNNDTTSGYFATMRSTDSPSAGQSWQAFWQSSLAANAYDMGADQFGNSIQFVIHRLCANAQPPASGGQCVTSPATTTVAGGNSEEAGGIQLQSSSSSVYYRITVRVTGPRRSETYVQAHFAM